MDLFDDEARTSIALLSDYTANLSIIETQIARHGSDITAPLPLMTQRQAIRDTIDSIKQQLYHKGLSDDDIATGLRLHAAHSWPTSRIPSQPRSSVMQKPSGFGWALGGIAFITIISLVGYLVWVTLGKTTPGGIGGSTPLSNDPPSAMNPSSVASPDGNQASPTRTTIATQVLPTPASSPPLTHNCLQAPGQILFTSGRDGNNDIYVMNPDGSGLKNLTAHIDNDTLARWSPDYQHIVFVSNRDGQTDIDLYRMNADGSDVKRLTTDTGDDPMWSPDGQYIAYTSKKEGDWEINIITADGTPVLPLTSNNYDDNRPDWSPDGTKIVYDARRSQGWEIHVVNVDGTGDTTLVADGNVNYSPVWSPDGSTIAFGKTRDENPEIYTMQQDGTNPIRLTKDGARDLDPMWSPDGECLIFESNRSGTKDLWLMDKQGGIIKNLTPNTPNSEEYFPAWRP